MDFFQHYPFPAVASSDHQQPGKLSNAAYVSAIVPMIPNMDSPFALPGWLQPPSQWQLPISPASSLPASRPNSQGNTTASLNEKAVESANSPIRPRLSREQTLLLEKHFAESPKPNTKVRQEIAENTGLSSQRVGNRRAKAKLKKKQEELQTRQILESAGRRRATEPSSPVSLCPTAYSLSHESLKDIIMASPKPRRSKSTTELPKTPSSKLRECSTNSSPYASPSEAGYASLVRSLAIAAAAAAHANAVGGFQEYSHELPPHAQDILGAGYPYSSMGHDGTESPWPVSAFSDYGSSRSSVIAYTPTPAGQLEDPFEFDHVTNSNQMRSSYSNNEPECGAFPQAPPVDDYAAFAAAIEMNSFSNNFVLPSFPPPKGLRERRLNNTFDNAVSQPPPPQPQFVRRDSLPSEMLNAFGAVGLRSSPAPLAAAPSGVETAIQGTQGAPQSNLAARRNRPKPKPLGNPSLCSKSFSGTYPTSADSESTEVPPATPMRRIRSASGASLKRKSRESPPPSPDLTTILDAALRDDFSCAGDTIRPRTSSSVTATMSNHGRSQLFQPLAAAPPTPVSPANGTSDEVDIPQETTASKHPNSMEFEMSPPPTPQNTLLNECTEIEPTFESRMEEYANPFEFDDALAMIPRGMYERHMEYFPFEFDLGEMMSASSGSSGMFMREDAFPFDRYTTTA
ncbi:hypothetical protein RUND412_006546 [Rhizina undulata]